MCASYFQPGNLTGWDSEGVKHEVVGMCGVLARCDQGYLVQSSFAAAVVLFLFLLWFVVVSLFMILVLLKIIFQILCLCFGKKKKKRKKKKKNLLKVKR